MARIYKETNLKTNKTRQLNQIMEELKVGECCYIISYERKLNKEQLFFEI